ncbi:hypothetical protein CYMTET_27698 [Cymbomonas tetramitiformis]|uniref:SAM-dependent MTase RsmB/NOP-type domain-containing protein n=1 Tax=Cymbomonas tetramitiformis TaxID=36881 RepID=A0AAE0KWY0_9CHLO|nr:hypothetical protein CYMTET_27698 [Cymbomonas tetramitiformis]
MSGRGQVYAFDASLIRLKRLKANAKATGATNVIAKLGDFLKTDPTSPQLSQVRALLVDPSCSGSGTQVSRGDVWIQAASETAGEEGGEGAEEEEKEKEARMQGLVRFQQAALKHALSFPAAVRVQYSTCSVHRRENEEVVAAVLASSAVQAAGWELEHALPTWPRRGLPTKELPEAYKVVRTDPSEDYIEGFFLAVFCREPPPLPLTAQAPQPQGGCATADKSARDPSSKKRKRNRPRANEQSELPAGEADGTKQCSRGAAPRLRATSASDQATKSNRRKITKKRRIVR